MAGFVTIKERVLIIAQLCLAFSLLFWLFLAPVLENHLVKREEVGLFEAVLGQEVLFSALPIEKQSAVIKGFKTLPERKLDSFATRFWKPGALLSLIWSLLAIALSIFLLLGVEGAHKTCFLLPLIVVAYGAIFLMAPTNKHDHGLFPSERYVVSHFLDEGEKVNKKSLTRAWEIYLLEHWTPQQPVAEIPSVEQAGFAFNLARIERRLSGGEINNFWKEVMAAPPTLAHLMLYFGWNLVFAFYLNRKKRVV